MVGRGVRQASILYAPVSTFRAQNVRLLDGCRRVAIGGAEPRSVGQSGQMGAMGYREGKGGVVRAARIIVELDLTADVRLAIADLARQLFRRFDRLEHQMSQISDYFDSTNATLGTVQAKLTDVAADVTALLAKAGGSGVFTPDEQTRADTAAATLTALSDALTTLDTQVGDQDGSESGGPTPPSV